LQKKRRDRTEQINGVLDTWNREEIIKQILDLIPHGQGTPKDLEKYVDFFKTITEGMPDTGLYYHEGYNNHPLFDFFLSLHAAAKCQSHFLKRRLVCITEDYATSNSKYTRYDLWLDD
jgi:hypothetical protein